MIKKIQISKNSRLFPPGPKISTGMIAHEPKQCAGRWAWLRPVHDVKAMRAQSKSLAGRNKGEQEIQINPAHTPSSKV